MERPVPAEPWPHSRRDVCKLAPLPCAAPPPGSPRLAAAAALTRERGCRPGGAPLERSWLLTRPVEKPRRLPRRAAPAAPREIPQPGSVLCPRCLAEAGSARSDLGCRLRPFPLCPRPGPGRSTHSCAKGTRNDGADCREPRSRQDKRARWEGGLACGTLGTCQGSPQSAPRPAARPTSELSLLGTQRGPACVLDQAAQVSGRGTGLTARSPRTTRVYKLCQQVPCASPTAGPPAAGRGLSLQAGSPGRGQSAPSWGHTGGRQGPGGRPAKPEAVLTV